ncbi:MAG TPA: hypothetical protein VHM31_04180 [Polyangia bacterium]|nr:hypothetical protein [Polyangia bacterium]
MPPSASAQALRACRAILSLVVLAGACTETLDAGHDRPHGPLPIDERNAVIVYQDDWSGDWLGEYAVLMANTGGPPLVGIVVNASKTWGSLSINTSGWKDLVNAARASGLKNIPDVTSSSGAPLTRPADGDILKTTPNNSAGAQLFINTSLRLSAPGRPVVIACGTSLTDVADAYLVDPTVVDRVVVVAAGGSYKAPTAFMGPPNGDADPWADWIVAQRFRYVQVNGYYDQTSDVTTAQLPSLPQNALGTRITNKLPNIITFPTASDQIALLAWALPMFATAVQPSAPDVSGGFDSTQGPPLVPAVNGNVWVVTQVAGPLAGARLWQMLLNPTTFGP